MLKNNPLLFTFFKWVVVGFFLGLGADLWVDNKIDHLFESDTENTTAIPKRGVISVERLTPQGRVICYPTADNDCGVNPPKLKPIEANQKPFFERVSSGFWHSLLGHELTLLGTFWGILYGRHRALKKKASIGQTITTPQNKRPWVNKKMNPRK